ncbi:MAG: c-type cytochrome [Acidobacteriaceae bacterium]
MRSFPAFVVAAALMAVLPVGAQMAPAGSGAQSNVRMHHEMPKPKNLQVLPKDISSHDLIATMRGYTAALGVECSFCHAPDAATHHPDFASDAKPQKTTARTMIRMTQAINAKYLSTVVDADASAEMKTVTCGTCHRGNSMPMPFDAGGAAKHSKS